MRQSNRAKKIRLSASGEGIILVLPRRSKWSVAQKFVDDNRNWIEQTWQRVKERQLLFDIRTIEVQGSLYPIEFGSGFRKIQFLDSGFSVPANSEHQARTKVEQFLKLMARKTLVSTLENWSARMGVHPQKIRIADQRSRWGSCSSKGTLSLNWRLIMAPQAVMEYIVIHELAHLKEMNHSSRFWAVVEKYCPDYRAHEKWLKENGPRLMQRPN